MCFMRICSSWAACSPTYISVPVSASRGLYCAAFETSLVTWDILRAVCLLIIPQELFHWLLAGLSCRYPHHHLKGYYINVLWFYKDNQWDLIFSSQLLKIQRICKEAEMRGEEWSAGLIRHLSHSDIGVCVFSSHCTKRHLQKFVSLLT